MAANELRNNCIATSKEDGQSSGGIKDGDEWIISMMEEKPLSPQDNKIHKVAPQLRKDNHEFFDPRIVSIGPCHHGKPELEEMENLKTRVAREFVVESEVDAHEFRNKILEVVSHARNCYVPGSTDKYDDEKFVRMMFVDGCFLLYVIDKFVRNHVVGLKEFWGHLGHGRIRVLFGDFMLVENQLPFLVLQTLMSTRFPEDKGEGLIETFIDLLSGQRQNGTKYDGDDEQVPLHFLELVRRRFLGSHCRREDVQSNWRPIATKQKDLIKNLLNCSFRSATELKARGIHFKPSTTLLLNDFTFTSRCLYGQVTLPPLIVNDQTKRMFLNMMANELAPFRVSEHDGLEVCNYIYFMNSLINGADDVIELRSQHIIHNFLGTDEEVAKLFNTLAAFFVFPPPAGKMRDVMDRIEEHYNSRRKTWTAQLLHSYFTTPWTAVALFAATFVLVLTFIQTVFFLEKLNLDWLEMGDLKGGIEIIGCPLSLFRSVPLSFSSPKSSPVPHLPPTAVTEASTSLGYCSLH